MILIYLDTLDLIYSSSRLQIIRRSVVSSLLKTYHFFKIVIPLVSSDTTTTTSDRFALVGQGRQTAGDRGEGRADMER